MTGRRAISSDQKRAAVTLAALVEADEAAAQPGFDRRSVRKWSAQAGKRPELDAASDELKDLYDLAVRKVTADVATGRITGSALMTVVGVARDMLDRARRWAAQAPSDGSGSAIAAHDAFADWLVDTIGTAPIDSEEALEATVAAIQDVTTMLLRRANAESDLSHQPPSPHRLAILAWHSGRPEVEAGDVLEWAQAQVLDVIETHGSLVAWHAFQQAEDEAEKARQEPYPAEIRAKAEALKAESDTVRLDAEERARLAAAELSRRSMM